MILIMSRVKQFLIFLLVVITIYSTLLFYLLMSVHADSRLQEIDYLEKSKFEGGDRAVYMDKITQLNDRFHHFTISLLRFRKARPPHCSKQSPQKAVLVISASAFDLITIYMKLLRELEAGNGECGMPEVFVLKKLRPLALTNQQNINKYAFEIGQIIKYLTIEGEYDISIFSHEEGAILTLAYFARRTINGLFHNIVEKVKALVLVDITQPFIRIMYDPPYKMIGKLKREIFNDRDRVKIFNKFKIVILSTHKEEKNLPNFQFYQGEEPFVFTNTVLISAREMANVHYYLPPNSLSFPPFVRRIGQFLSKISAHDMEISEIYDFFRYGESYDYEKLQEFNIKGCLDLSLTKEDSVVTQSPCIKLTAVNLNDSQVLTVYSPNHFEMYSNELKRIYPFDNLTEGSIYLFDQIRKCAYIMNPEEVNVYVTKQSISTPQNSLPISNEQIFATSQLIFSNYSVVNVCPNLNLIFPLHFAQGKSQRKFLTKAEGECFEEDNILEEFSWQFFLHWSLFRNIIIFTLLCSEYRKQFLSQRLIQQFFINILLLLNLDTIHSKFFYALYIVSFSLLVEYISKSILYICSKVTLRKKWANILLLVISAICLLCSFLNLINVWGWFLIAMVFFINQENIMIILIKLYFLKDTILYGENSFQVLTELGLLVMWLYTTLPSNKNDSLTYWTPERLFSGLLMIGVAFSLDSSGTFIDNLLTIFMKVLIVVKMLRIIKK